MICPECQSRVTGSGCACGWREDTTGAVEVARQCIICEESKVYRKYIEGWACFEHCHPMDRTLIDTMIENRVRDIERGDSIMADMLRQNGGKALAKTLSGAWDNITYDDLPK